MNYFTKIVTFFVLLTSFASAHAETVYPSLKNLPFPWDKPEMAIDLDHLQSRMPLGEYTLKSYSPVKGEAPLSTGECTLSIQKDDSAKNLIFTMNGLGQVMGDGKFDQENMSVSFTLPLSHYVEPLREQPISRFGFPDVFITTGSLKATEDSNMKLTLHTRKGFILSKVGNSPWVVAQLGFNDSITLTLDDKGSSLIGFSYLDKDSENLGLLSCASESGVKLPKMLNQRSLFSKDLP